MVMGASPARSSSRPAISVGSGPSTIVEYDFDFKPQKVYVGFRTPTDITPLADGSLLVADEGAQEVVAFDPSTGAISYRRRFLSGVLRARPRPLGGLVVTSGDKVLLTDPALNVQREIPVRGVRVAVELPGGHILTASNDDQGWVTELRPDGSILWRSKPRARRDPAGKWVSEQADQTFTSTSSLDVRQDGEIFAADFDAHSLRLLSKDHLVLRAWSIPGLGHFSDTRFGPTGELIAVAPETLSLWIERGDGKTRTWTSPGIALPLCVNLSARGTILVGFQWRPENEQLNATRQLSSQHQRPPFHRTFPAAVLLGMSAALLVCAALRWRDTETASAPRHLPQVTDVAAIQDRPAAPPPSKPGKSLGVEARAVQIGGALVALVFAVAVAWKAVLGSGGVAPHKMLWFAFASAIGAIALRVLNALLGSSATFSSFSPAPSDGPVESRNVRRLAMPVGLALSSLIVCLLGVLFRPNHPGLAVAAWIAAQIFILAAAFDRPAPRIGHSDRRATALLLGLVLFGAIITRFWEIGQYPDFTHWDQGTYGSAALKVLRGDWSPFFVMEPINRSISRPWIAICAVLLGVFGPHYWVLRLTAAISGVMVVLGTYLLGSSLLNRRAGLVGAFLASINHVLLLYSRQPYVLDPAPFFVLALYCVTLGLRSGRRLPWCLAGVLSGWCLLTYWASTALAVVGAAIFGGFALFYPRWLWRRRMGLLWMLLGAVIVYLPMVPNTIASRNVGTRLQELAVVSTPDGSVQRNPAVWKNQLQNTFGTILQNGESSGWSVSTEKPVAFGPETVLFGIGLISLLLYRPRAPALVLLPWIAFGFLLGNGFFLNPSFYHCLGSIPPILLVSAVAVDRLLALSDPWKPSMRVAPVLSALLVLALIGALHLRALWDVVGRPSSRRANSQPVLRADLRSIVPLYIREHPNRRYYLIRTSTELSCAEPSFTFFADDSDISDLTGPLEQTLPVPPTDPPREVAFIVLPGRAAGIDFIHTVYPNARMVELQSTALAKPVQIMIVDADSVRRAFESVPGGVGDAGHGRRVVAPGPS
jgi:4-amino-4-deoxy-L-arabinose transferase-like glycosyltransferase